MRMNRVRGHLHPGGRRSSPPASGSRRSSPCSCRRSSSAGRCRPVRRWRFRWLGGGGVLPAASAPRYGRRVADATGVPAVQPSPSCCPRRRSIRRTRSDVVAFPGHPIMVLARFVASLATAVVVGWVWQASAATPRCPPIRRAGGREPWERARLTAAMTGASLRTARIGAATAATLNVVIPRTWLDHLGGNAVAEWSRSACCGGTRRVLRGDASCASLTQFSLTAAGVMAVGRPSSQAHRDADRDVRAAVRVRFAPLTLVTAAVAASIVGAVLL